MLDEVSSLEVCLDGCQGELTPVPPLGDGLEASGALQEGASSPGNYHHPFCHPYCDSVASLSPCCDA